MENGIKEESIPERVKAFGSNEPPLKELKGFCRLLLEALDDVTLIVLIISAVVSTIIKWFAEADHRGIGINVFFLIKDFIEIF